MLYPEKDTPIIGTPHVEDYNPPHYDIPESDQVILIEEEVVVVKKKHRAASPPNGKWVKYYAKVTAYTTGAESCGVFADGKTSIGVNVHSGDPDELYGIAADPRILPYGTFIYIKEYEQILKTNTKSITSTQYENVDDTGSGMKGFISHYRDGNYIEFHLDVRFSKLKTALKWGVKYIPVYVWEKNN